MRPIKTLGKEHPGSAGSACISSCASRNAGDVYNSPCTLMGSGLGPTCSTFRCPPEFIWFKVEMWKVMCTSHFFPLGLIQYCGDERVERYMDADLNQVHSGGKGMGKIIVVSFHPASGWSNHESPDSVDSPRCLLTDSHGTSLMSAEINDWSHIISTKFLKPSFDLCNPPFQYHSPSRKAFLLG